MELDYQHNFKSGSRFELLISDRNILDALAYAAETGIPPEQVLEALKRATEHNPWSRLLLRSGWNRSIQQLRSGVPVSEVLRRRGTPYYLCSAAACAEKNGTLPVVLPVLARNLRWQRLFAGNTVAVLSANVILWLAIFMLLTGMMAFVVPNLDKVFMELLGSAETPFSTHSGYLQYLCFLPLLVIASLVLFVCSMNAYCLEWLYLGLPFFGTMMKRRVLYDLSGMFYCLLAGGMDIGEAARAAAASEPRFWMRRRLERFAAAVEAGEPFFPSWKKHIRLGTPMSDWLLHGGAVRGKLPESFLQLRRILLEENQGSNFRFNICLKVAVTFVNAFIVGSIGFIFFYFMTKIILKS